MSGGTFQPEWPNDGKGCLAKWQDGQGRRWGASYLWCCWKIPSHSALQLPTLWGQKHKVLAKSTENATPLTNSFPLSTHEPEHQLRARLGTRCWTDGQWARQPILMELAWGVSGAHMIISDGPINLSTATETGGGGGGYFRHMVREGLSQEWIFELRPKRSQQSTAHPLGRWVGPQFDSIQNWKGTHPHIIYKS